MITIRHTHLFDLLYKLALMIGMLAIVGLIAAILEPKFRALTQAGVKKGVPELVFSCIAAACAGAGFFPARFLLVKTVLNPILPSYLYIRFSLRTAVTWQEAEQLDFLFCGDAEGKWHPLKEVRRLSKADRRAALFEFADVIRSAKSR